MRIITYSLPFMTTERTVGNITDKFYVIYVKFLKNLSYLIEKKIE